MSKTANYYFSGDLSNHDPVLISKLVELANIKDGMFNVLKDLTLSNDSKLIGLLTPRYVFTNEETLYEKIRGDDKIKIGWYKPIHDNILSKIDLKLRDTDDESRKIVQYLVNHLCVYGSPHQRYSLDELYKNNIILSLTDDRDFKLYERILELPGLKDDNFYRWIEMARSIHQLCQYTIDKEGICVCVVIMENGTNHVLASKTIQDSVLELETLTNDTVQSSEVVEFRKYLIPRRVCINFPEMIKFGYAAGVYQSLFYSEIFLRDLALFDEFVTEWIIR